MMTNSCLDYYRHPGQFKFFFIVFTASEDFNLLKCDIFTFRFSLPVTATAENCMLTIYSYMAIHLDEQKIIVKNGKLL